MYQSRNIFVLWWCMVLIFEMEFPLIVLNALVKFNRIFFLPWGSVRFWKEAIKRGSFGGPFGLMCAMLRRWLKKARQSDIWWKCCLCYRDIPSVKSQEKVFMQKNKAKKWKNVIFKDFPFWTWKKSLFFPKFQLFLFWISMNSRETSQKHKMCEIECFCWLSPFLFYNRRFYWTMFSRNKALFPLISHFGNSSSRVAQAMLLCSFCLVLWF